MFKNSKSLESLKLNLLMMNSISKIIANIVFTIVLGLKFNDKTVTRNNKRLLQQKLLQVYLLKFIV